MTSASHSSAAMAASQLVSTPEAETVADTVSAELAAAQVAVAKLVKLAAVEVAAAELSAAETHVGSSIRAQSSSLFNRSARIWSRSMMERNSSSSSVSAHSKAAAKADCSTSMGLAGCLPFPDGSCKHTRSNHVAIT